MARGNAYLIVPKTEQAAKIPDALKPSLAWYEPVLDGTGEVKSKKEKHPTWREAGERNMQQFGEIREHTHAGRDYLIIELELSFLRGDIEAMLKLQGNNKDYIILNNTEAIAWLAGEDVFR